MPYKSAPNHAIYPQPKAVHWVIAEIIIFQYFNRDRTIYDPYMIILGIYPKSVNCGGNMA